MSDSEVVGNNWAKEIQLRTQEVNIYATKSWKMYKQFAEITVVSAAVCFH
jgi:hypothetical protein